MSLHSIIHSTKTVESTNMILNRKIWHTGLEFCVLSSTDIILECLSESYIYACVYRKNVKKG